MRLSLFKIAVLLLALGGITFAVAPFFAFRALKAATAAEDVQAVSELVDYAALRKSLTSQLVDTAPKTGEAPSIWQDPIGALKNALQPLAPPEPKVDAYMTLDGLSALTRGYQPGHAPPAAKPDKTMSGQARAIVKDPWARPSYWGPNRTRLTVSRPGQKSKKTTLIFERKGWFTWKLVAVQLPPDER
ncbi:hypothetical protein QO010_000171 [Caulobacter ginsengisoli]|uniref:DUF2939 domain-containing protein n=1 Tax=Caulobacter ginsengisoli TaxID=400775 RepID=A0ABU0IK90_9CAUL|nr:DUF2939 domain-containing protein [Caulobacter ginsengisoli]MDQ0462423.1 hypothetical protein [Caulobacter ginsengisoli]